ncbi:bifunctional DedA family/phosphatase PAP2 family protein [Marinobacter sp. CHS3-4]|uniref:bifunctional DedA family/phosphatase PAP2 family protein n=1 Tax=Marinobacter sp. CHS3-4 TaxID=3045174 RepID=UPI0024B54D2C|nr:bifunctional DedA family/phosphatase PAP2 family protein [Marinobacter sp. CHS3-4]MDI9246233.1 bifunctional DedA family/phosphatase PAP2 family protein [Marinobacter sp. CHS3-4]
MTADGLQPLTDWLAMNPQWLAFALFLTAFLESLALAGIIIPGVAILFAIAALAGQTAMPLMQVLLWAGAGAIAGDGLSFGLGRWFQGRLDQLWPLSRYPALITRGERFFRRHGGKSVVVGRFVGPIRPVIPLIAGAFLMPWRRFLAFNFASAIGWAPVYILPGYLVGSAMASAIKPPPHFYLVVGIGVAILTVIYLLIFRFQLGLVQGSRAYEWLAAKMRAYDSTHRFWRLYSSHRPDHAGEFPLPSMMLGLGCLALFAILSQLALATDLLVRYDQLAVEWLSQLRHPLLDKLFIAITLMGDTAILLSAAVLMTALFAFRGFYSAALHIATATILASLVVWLLKDATAIARPDLASASPDSVAFPSGHATGITLFCALTASFVAREFRTGQRWQFYLAFSLPIVLVATSRIYLGVHWPTDILAGIFLGMAIAGLTRTSFSRFDNTPVTLDATLILTITIWVGFSAAYLFYQWPQALMAYGQI